MSLVTAAISYRPTIRRQRRSIRAVFPEPTGPPTPILIGFSMWLSPRGTVRTCTSGCIVACTCPDGSPRTELHGEANQDRRRWAGRFREDGPDRPSLSTDGRPVRDRGRHQRHLHQGGRRV